MKFIAGQGWGMPFIVGPNYVPQDPEYIQHYKPEQQGCADCNGVSVPPQTRKTFQRDVLTCDGLKTIQTTRPPDVPPVYNREMNVNAGAYGGVGAIATLKHTRVIGKSTRDMSEVEIIVVDPQNVV